MIDTLDNAVAIKIANGLKFKTPRTIAAKSVRENLETLKNHKGGQFFQVYYLREDNRPKFTKRVMKIQRFSLQKADYEARASVKELRATGKEADTTNKKNEVMIDSDLHLSYNEKTGKYKIGFPTSSQQGKPETMYFLDGVEVSQEEYNDYVNSFYAPKKYGEFVQAYFSLNVENIICIN